MQKEKNKIGIIGKGQFTNFIVPMLEKNFEVIVFGREEKSEEVLQSLDYLVFSIPLQSIEEVCKEIQYKVSENTVIVDVTSVKVEPLRLLKKYFLNNPILGTHPIFGPQSGKNGIEGLTIVLCNQTVEEEKYSEIKNYFQNILKLKVLEKSPIVHDREMAVVQGLSHFIGRALKMMDVEDYDTATKSYRQLLNLKELVGNDSWELYKTIQNGNPYTEEVRKEFLRILQNLELNLKEESLEIPSELQKK